MIRKAFIMYVHPDKHQEYTLRHDELWPEMAAMLKEHGGHNYSIFLDAKTNQLFGYVEIESEQRWQAVAKTEVCQRWWESMASLMPSNSDNSPESRELTPVFYLA